MWIILLEII